MGLPELALERRATPTPAQRSASLPRTPQPLARERQCSAAECQPRRLPSLVLYRWTNRKRSGKPCTELAEDELRTGPDAIQKSWTPKEVGKRLQLREHPRQQSPPWSMAICSMWLTEGIPRSRPRRTVGGTSLSRRAPRRAGAWSSPRESFNMHRSVASSRPSDHDVFGVRGGRCQESCGRTGAGIPHQSPIAWESQ